MKFNYLPVPLVDPKTQEIKGVIYRPYIPIMFSFAHQITPRAINCLVDSGSDINLFPAEVGEQIGIPIKKGRLVPVLGIGQKEVIAYRHNVKLYLGATNFLTDIDFCFEQRTPLLGRIGFFTGFKRVSFREPEKTLELEK